MNSDEKSLLSSMIEEGLLTAAQGRRVATALGHGASLEEALGRTPLIDPLEYHKALRKATPPDAVSEVVFSTPSNESLRALETVATYDLSEDQAIPLVARLNELLGEVFYGGLAGLEIGRRAMEAGWSKLYDSKGTSMAERPIGPGQAEKMIVRLRVMARLSPTAKEAAMRRIVFVGNGLKAEAIVESSEHQVRVHIYREKGVMSSRDGI